MHQFNPIFGMIMTSRGCFYKYYRSFETPSFNCFLKWDHQVVVLVVGKYEKKNFTSWDDDFTFRPFMTAIMYPCVCSSFLLFFPFLKTNEYQYVLCFQNKLEKLAQLCRTWLGVSQSSILYIVGQRMNLILLCFIFYYVAHKYYLTVAHLQSIVVCLFNT